jgi:hypothetical protein
MLRCRLFFASLTFGFAFAITVAGTPAAGPGDHKRSDTQGSGIVIELDNQFIEDYQNRATITSEFKIAGLSGVHGIGKSGDDGEVHIGGWSYEVGLPCVAEVMNAASSGKKGRQTFQKALNAHKKVTVTGAWRFWCEHGGLTSQIQAPKGAEPKHWPLAGEHLSNPDHVFEIHPVTSVKSGNVDVDIAETIGETTGYQYYDAQVAFKQDYEMHSCTIIPKPNNRTRILTEAARHNFTAFIIRLDENPHELEDGHGAICTVYDTDGDLVVRNRRMVFIKGTDADDEVQGLTQGKRLKVLGMPRISLKLIKWRLDHKDDEGFDTSPLKWRLPYEMVILAAERIGD